MIKRQCRRGVQRAECDPPGDEWSQLIWDLIRTSVTTAWNTGGRSGSSRAWNQAAFFATGTVPRVLLDTSLEAYAADLWARAGTDDAPPSDREELLTADRDDGGLPIVFIDAETPDVD